MNVQLTSSKISNLSLTDMPIYLNSIAGLSSSEIRTSSYQNSGEDGGFVDSQFYGARLISLTGVIDDGSCQGNLTGRSNLLLATPIRQYITADFTLTDGRIFTTKGKVVGFEMPYNLDDRSEYKLDLFCEDPLLYDKSAGTELCIQLERYVASGLQWPLQWVPLQWGTGAAGTVTATNTGVAPTYPTITINGKVTDPRLSNRTTGRLFKINITTSGTDQIVINMRDRMVTLNGSSIYHLIDEQSSWWKLVTGGNNILFETNNSIDTGTAEHCWLPAYYGV